MDRRLLILILSIGVLLSGCLTPEGQNISYSLRRPGLDARSSYSTDVSSAQQPGVSVFDIRFVDIAHAMAYLPFAVLLAILFRLVLTSFNAYAVMRGEAGSKRKKSGKRYSFKRSYWESFWGFKDDRNVDNYWLPALIGLAELIVYPFLIITNHLVLIGVWLVLKVMAYWGKQQGSRILYYRFILANMLVLAAAYISSVVFLTVK
ncbi:MAG: hypothetical protein PHR44_02465 [Candidatus Omnitrophica bacterium]|nr:hypothetical protein [Candidatus Omnitrophota bacterium]